MNTKTADERYFKNPILPNGADPYIYKHSDGFYYLTVTTGKNLTVWKSKTLTGIKEAENRIVYSISETGPNSGGIWAPEIYWFNGKWYIYYTSWEKGMGSEKRVFVIENSSSDIYADNWVFKGKIFANPDMHAIDGSVLELNGEMYFLWCGRETNERKNHCIYIAKMSDPWTAAGERVLLSKADYEWEKKINPELEFHTFINEGPIALKRNGKVFIIYSACNFITDDYCLGMLTADENSDLLDKSAWTKSEVPVFKQSPENGVFSPGHNSFTKSPDDTEDWIVYHAFNESIKNGPRKYKRSLRIQKFGWKEDGTPDFGVPVSTEEWLPVPSGE